MIEVCKFLLQEGMDYVLTERFCQDLVEEYFGSQRKLGRQNDNPDIRTFGHNDNAIRIRVEILEEEKTSTSHGLKSQITHYHPERKVEKNINCFVFEQK